MSAPLISVVMPIYNGAGFLPRAIASLRRQTFAGWELLAVDDASADGSFAVLTRLAQEDPRIRPLRRGRNGGPGAARNDALRLSRGPWVAYLDQDDEFYPDYLAQVAAAGGRGDVLVFAYDLVEERPGHPARGAVTAWDPRLVADRLHLQNISVPLGVAHRRDLLGRVGLFDEREMVEQDWDLWKRFARAGATFVYLPRRSGRYHVRADSLARTWPGGPRDSGTPRLLFASPHCYADPSSGAALATRDLLGLLAARAWPCRAVCGPALDFEGGGELGQVLADQRLPVRETGAPGGRRYDFVRRGVPVTVWEPAGPPRPPGPAGGDAFLRLFAEAVEEFRPDVLLTYGGAWPMPHLLGMARRRGLAVVFALHNFAYADASLFRDVDAVLVPSPFAAGHYRRTLGLSCTALPGLCDLSRTHCDAVEGRYATFVNPQPAKGLFWFARLAHELGRRRPDIPLLVVEGRGKADALTQTGLDFSTHASLFRMAHTPEPRDFYRVSRLVLMPSLWRESLGRVAVEALDNGIPVVASTRGALPWTLGRAGVLLDVPERYTPEGREVPTAEEVAPWREAVERLWDDEAYYHECRRRCREAAAGWQPESLLPRYEEFFRHLASRRLGRRLSAA